MDDASPPTGMIPVSCFDTRQLPPAQAMPLWREQISSLFDSRPRLSIEDGFFACVEAYYLESCAIGINSGGAQDFDRSPRKLVRDGMDGYLLQFYQSGTSMPRASGGHGMARPGDLYIIDLAQPLATAVTSYTNLNLLVPRHALAPLLRQPDGCHEAVLPARQPLVALFRETLESFYRQLGAMTMAQAQPALRPLLDLAAVAVNNHIGEAQAGSVNLARLAMLRRYVEESLLDPALSAERVAAAFGLSLRSLYRAFAPFDGFAAYVKDRRLRRARAALLDQANRHLPIAEVGERHGFASPEQFSRAFRQLFGMTPREVRHVTRETAPRLRASGTSWEHWVRQVGRQGR